MKTSTDNIVKTTYILPDGKKVRTKKKNNTVISIRKFDDRNRLTSHFIGNYPYFNNDNKFVAVEHNINIDYKSDNTEIFYSDNRPVKMTTFDDLNRISEEVRYYYRDRVFLKMSVHKRVYEDNNSGDYTEINVDTGKTTTIIHNRNGIELYNVGFIEYNNGIITYHEDGKDDSIICIEQINNKGLLIKSQIEDSIHTFEYDNKDREIKHVIDSYSRLCIIKTEYSDDGSKVVNEAVYNHGNKEDNSGNYNTITSYYDIYGNNIKNIVTYYRQGTKEREFIVNIKYETIYCDF